MKFELALGEQWNESEEYQEKVKIFLSDILVSQLGPALTKIQQTHQQIMIYEKMPE